MEGTADYCTFGTDLADVLHVEVDDGGSQAGREEVMDLLGEIFGVGQNHKEALFFIAEPLEGVEEETDSLSNSFGGGDDEMVHAVSDLEKLSLEIRRHDEFKFAQALDDGGVVLKVLGQSLLFLHLLINNYRL